MMQSFNLEGLQAPPREEVEKIAVLPLRGSIAETAPSSYLQWNTTFITPETVKDNLDKAADDPQVKAVILRINSPGGSSAASQEISAMIKKFRQETSKPIVVSMADTATSGAYYISVYADRIIANPSTITGGIGVKFTVSNMEELYKKLGIEMEIIKSGEHEDIGYRPLTKEEKEILQDVCDQAHGQFIRAVAEGRGISEEEVRKIATGRIYLGQEALELGLIDELGGLDRAIEIACELAEIEKPIVERYEVSGMVPFPEISPSSLSEDELLLMIANYQAELCY
jgi:protease-4